MDRCEHAALWMDQAGTGAPVPPAIAEHLAACPACRRRAALQDAAASLFRQATEGPAVPIPPLSAIRRAPRPGWQHRRQVLGFAGVLAAAAVLAVTWAAWPTDPGTTGPGGTIAVPVGQVIESGGGEVAIADPRFASVTLGARSRLTVDAWGADATRLRLQQGRLEADVLHRETGETFEVRTDLAVIRVVGTRFVVSCVPGVETIVTGLEGVVQVDATDGTPVGRVTAGLTLRVTAPDGSAPAGSAPRVSTDLPAGPDGVPPIARAESVPTASRSGLPPTPDAPLSSSSAVARVRPRPAPKAVPYRPTAEQSLATALALLSRGADREALDALTAALVDAGVQRPRLLALLGDLHRIAGRLQEARLAYEESLSTGDASVGEGVLVDLAALQQDGLGRPEAAAATWRRYLETFPRGRYVSRALWQLSRIAENAGRTEEALSAWRRLAVECPGSEEAPGAFVRVGRVLIERGDLPAAEAWFQGRMQDPGTAYAEAATVGLIRIRLAQGRGDDVRAMAAGYAQRFPAGERRGEVLALLDAAAPSKRDP